ncbi:hypothetical protein EDD21DRAFT_241673 [Dissophora ornata]|nr:hypothetical protein EDD21DRAFT_241673 [Dissophora ornata]
MMNVLFQSSWSTSHAISSMRKKRVHYNFLSLQDATFFGTSLSGNLFRKADGKTAPAYVAQMPLAPSPEPGDFTKHIERAHPRAQSLWIARAWHQLKEYFGGEKDVDYSYLESLTSVPGLVSTLKMHPTSRQTSLWRGGTEHIICSDGTLVLSNPFI